jgi:hypothetical protein
MNKIILFLIACLLIACSGGNLIHLFPDNAEKIVPHSWYQLWTKLNRYQKRFQVTVGLSLLYKAIPVHAWYYVKFLDLKWKELPNLSFENILRVATTWFLMNQESNFFKEKKL